MFVKRIEIIISAPLILRDIIMNNSQLYNDLFIGLLFFVKLPN